VRLAMTAKRQYRTLEETGRGQGEGGSQKIYIHYE
jgi:hypothetical protein